MKRNRRINTQARPLRHLSTWQVRWLFVLARVSEVVVVIAFVAVALHAAFNGSVPE